MSVENYLKAILSLHEEGKPRVSTTELARRVEATPASTSAMLKKLGEKGWGGAQALPWSSPYVIRPADCHGHLAASPTLGVFFGGALGL